MKILWLTWKDLEHPLAGGAEVVTAELTKRLAKDGHKVQILSGGFEGAKKEINQNGCKVVRVGGRMSVYWQAYKYYKKHLEKESWDIIIEEINTIPFFSKFYIKSANKHFLFFHQLAREIWFYQMHWLISWIGYLAEIIYLWLLSFKSSKIITVSNSTKKDLIKYGFKKNNITIISEGIQMQRVKDIEMVKKYEKPTILSLGAIRPMKRTMDIVKAFEFLKKRVPNANLLVAGDDKCEYAKKVLEYIKKSPFSADIKVLGRVSVEKKLEIMQKSCIIVVTSIKEGWGLIVTESNSQGTPAVVYDVDGLRDSVKDNETGRISKHNTPKSLALAMEDMLQCDIKYNNLRKNAWKWSKEITFEQSYKDLCGVFDIK